MAAKKLSLDEALIKTDVMPQFFGLQPYVFSQESFKLRLSPWRAIYSGIIILLLSGFLLIKFLLPKTSMESKWTDEEYRIVQMKLLANCGTSIVTLISSMVLIKEENNALEALKNSHISAITPKRSFLFLFFILISILFALDMIVYEPIAYLENYWGFYVSTLINAACVYQFIGILAVLEDAFHQMQEWIQEQPNPRLEQAICSFERVTTAAEHYNEAFGLQLLLIVGTNFLLSTTDAFLIVTNKDTFLCLLYGGWCAASAGFPFKIVYAIDHLLQKRNEFNNILNTLLAKGYLFSSAAESGKVKLHVSMKKDLQFTARGFFTLDYGLINSMLGAVTTYLVILLQFNQPS